jgi:ATP-binding cassette subfamily B multidrug efflux pump
MKDLAYLNKFFYKYRWRLVPGVLFVIISNIFGVLPAQVIRVAFDWLPKILAFTSYFGL